MIKPATFRFFGTTASAAAHLILFYSLDTFTPLPPFLPPSLSTHRLSASRCFCLCERARAVSLRLAPSRSPCLFLYRTYRRQWREQMRGSQRSRCPEDPSLGPNTLFPSGTSEPQKAARYVWGAFTGAVFSLALHKNYLDHRLTAGPTSCSTGRLFIPHKQDGLYERDLLRKRRLHLNLLCSATVHAETC